jgi:hypothetical protein
MGYCATLLWCSVSAFSGIPSKAHGTYLPLISHLHLHSDGKIKLCIFEKELRKTEVLSATSIFFVGSQCCPGSTLLLSLLSTLNGMIYKMCGMGLREASSIRGQSL